MPFRSSLHLTYRQWLRTIDQQMATSGRISYLATIITSAILSGAWIQEIGFKRGTVPKGQQAHCWWPLEVSGAASDRQWPPYDCRLQHNRQQPGPDV